MACPSTFTLAHVFAADSLPFSERMHQWRMASADGGDDFSLAIIFASYCAL